MNPSLKFRESADACPGREEAYAPSAVLSLCDFAKEHVTDDWYTWAMDNYKRTIIGLARTYQCTSLLEVGGGRSPLFSEAEICALGVRYVVNDISEMELKMCPSWVEKACFDIAGAHIPTGTYDLIVSRMVMEHVRSGESAYRNIHSLLQWGGIALNFHPTLFAPPFVINSLMPVQLSKKILDFLAASRATDASEPYQKFPAYYSWCRSTSGIKEKIRKLGFRDVFAAPFYGHGYLRNIPFVSALDDRLSNLARAAGFRPYSSYVYVMVRR